MVKTVSRGTRPKLAMRLRLEKLVASPVGTATFFPYTDSEELKFKQRVGNTAWNAAGPGWYASKVAKRNNKEGILVTKIKAVKLKSMYDKSKKMGRRKNVA